MRYSITQYKLAGTGIVLLKAMPSCLLHTGTCVGDMISKTTFKLANALAPNFGRSVEWNKDIFLAWAERILTNQEKPPGFLMVPLPDSQQTTFNYYSDVEGKLLKNIRSLYESEFIHRVSHVSRNKKHKSHA